MIIPGLIRTALLSTLLVLTSGCAVPQPRGEQTPDEQTPVALDASSERKSDFLVIAHRGASGYRPEHTLAAYELAIAQGADFIEPDLVATRDGHLIARHENALAEVELTADHRIKRDASGAPIVRGATTDIADHPEFAERLTVRTIDGRPVGGWFSEDFDLAEIQSLYARERIPELRQSNTRFDTLPIPTLREIIELLAQPQHSSVGMYPELKHPSHFLLGQRMDADGRQKPISIDTAQLLVTALQEQAFTDPDRLYIQCFEVAPLRRLKHSLLPAADITAPLVQLFGSFNRSLPDVTYHSNSMADAYGPLALELEKSATYGDLFRLLGTAAEDYAAGIGIRKGDTQQAGARARELGLAVHPYTVRAENFFLSRLRGAVGSSVAAELDQLKRWGATGVFIDQPDQAVSWRNERAQQTATTP